MGPMDYVIFLFLWPRPPPTARAFHTTVVRRAHSSLLWGEADLVSCRDGESLQFHARRRIRQPPETRGPFLTRLRCT